jgi:hypothetical protein
MKNTCYKIALVAGLLPLVVAGCSTLEVANMAQAPVDTSSHAIKTVKSPPLPSALEVQYGIQITQLGLTASGGLVDVRFKVLDAGKARKLLGNPANAPMLMAGDKPPLMAPHNALRGAKFGPGQVFYILYPNLRSAIKPGTEVTVAMGEARLGPVTAQ